MASRLAVLQAIRAKAMQWTVGREYHQPAHTFLAEKLPDSAELHRQVALPGAMRAIHLDALAHFHERGMDQHEIVAEVNAITMAQPDIASRREHFRRVFLPDHAERLRVAEARMARRRALALERDLEIERRLSAELGEV